MIRRSSKSLGENNPFLLKLLGACTHQGLLDAFGSMLFYKAELRYDRFPPLTSAMCVHGVLTISPVQCAQMLTAQRGFPPAFHHNQ